ncbi:MAG: hypothetical protein U1A77_01970 [Pirellulales bacterium]
MAKTSTADRNCLRNHFAVARATLLANASAIQLDRPLSYWALPADRRLPVALLDRPLRDIVQTPFDRLAATPGIGQKKLGTLVLLMERVIDADSTLRLHRASENNDQIETARSEHFTGDAPACSGTLGAGLISVDDASVPLAAEGACPELPAVSANICGGTANVTGEALDRGPKEEQSGAAFTQHASSVESPFGLASASDPCLDPDRISETQWNQWCETTRRHGLEREKLGRLAPTLQELPNVIWDAALGEYSKLSLAQVRRLKTHGEKRVRVVLEVFRSLHLLLGGMGRSAGLTLRLSPSFVPPLEDWFSEMAVRTTPLAWHELRSNLVLPLLNQLAYDAGPLVQKLAEGRLGVENPPETVRVLADRVGVTRARVYQLLETCQRVMSVRWPEGRLRFDLLAARLTEWPLEPETLQLFAASRELFYPQPKPADPTSAERQRSQSNRSRAIDNSQPTTLAAEVAASDAPSSEVPGAS